MKNVCYWCAIGVSLVFYWCAIGGPLVCHWCSIGVLLVGHWCHWCCIGVLLVCYWFAIGVPFVCYWCAIGERRGLKVGLSLIRLKETRNMDGRTDGQPDIRYSNRGHFECASTRSSHAEVVVITAVSSVMC